MGRSPRKSSWPNYNSQEALGTHSPRDVTSEEGAGGLG